MNLSLIWRLNHRKVTLNPDNQFEEVGVWLESGELRFILWKGFISLADAKSRNKEFVRPVKLNLCAYIKDDCLGRIPPGSYVQECLVVGEGVYVVLVDGLPRTV